MSTHAAASTFTRCDPLTSDIARLRGNGWHSAAILCIGLEQWATLPDGDGKAGCRGLLCNIANRPSILNWRANDLMLAAAGIPVA